jgi:hypothetical protein
LARTAKRSSIMFSLPTLSFWLAVVSALVALGMLAYAIGSAVRVTRIAPKLRLVERIQGQWRSQLLKDQAVAGRLVDVITAPVVRQDFRLALTIGGSPLQEATDLDGDETNICVAVDAEFDFVNLGSKPIVMSLRRAPTAGLMRSGGAQEVTSLSIDGMPHELTEIMDTKKSLDLEIPPGSKREMHITSTYFGTLPYVAVFPQNIPVRGDSEIHLVSHVRDRTMLLVTGPHDCVRYDDDWWESKDELDYRLRIVNPLFPGDTILLAVGV